jgi:hypothetical protein
MSCMILSDERRAIRDAIKAAWLAGHAIGRAGVVVESGADDCADQLGPMLELQLFEHIEPDASQAPVPVLDQAEDAVQQLWAAANQPTCGVCGLPPVAHDQGNAQHEYEPRRGRVLAAPA